MMPLNFASVGEEIIIKKVGGNPETKKHLENLGFVPGGNVKIIMIIECRNAEKRSDKPILSVFAKSNWFTFDFARYSFQWV